jgi:hypothetical protein
VNNFYVTERAVRVRQMELLDEAQRERRARNLPAYRTTPRRPRIRVGRLLVEFGVRLVGAQSAQRAADPRQPA